MHRVAPGTALLYDLAVFSPHQLPTATGYFCPWELQSWNLLTFMFQLPLTPNPAEQSLQALMLP